MKNQITVIGAFFGAVVFSLSSPAGAQNALGDGQALDSNLGVGSGGRNDAPISARDSQYQLNNLIVTGNVAGGRGFRDSVGYSAPTDFRGTTAEDDLFRFRADSALSQLAYVTSAAGASSLDLGQAMGLLEFRRSSAGADLGMVSRSVPTYGLMSAIESRIDEAALIRSTQAGPLDPSFTGTLFAITPLEDGSRVRMRVSETRGVQMVREQSDVSLLGLTLYDQARLVEDQLQGLESPMIGQPFVMEENQYRLSLERLDQPAAESQRFTGVTEDYDQVIRAIADRVGETTVTTERTEQVDHASVLGESIARVRDFLRGRSPEDEAEGEEGEAAIEPFDPLAPALPHLADGLPSLPPEERDLRRVDVSILRHGTRVDRLAPEGRTRLAEILESAESHLANRDYFFAERDFLRAIRFQPNHPLAMAGAANAQLGAGLVSAAASNLRNLLTQHPEMIDVRYGTRILPPRERLEEIVSILRGRLEDEVQPKRDAGLLLAYIGHQIGNREYVVEGLNLLREADRDDPLAGVLRGVWLADESQPAPGSGD